MGRDTIVVYGASSQDVEKVFSDAAYRLGQLIARSGKRLVSGAGATGLMAAVEDGVLAAGGTIWSGYDLWKARKHLPAELTTLLKQAILDCQAACRGEALK